MRAGEGNCVCLFLTPHAIQSQARRPRFPREAMDKGFSQIPHKLAENVARSDLSPHESRCLWAIIRKTFGWQKESDRISLQQFSDATGLDRRHIHRALKKLEQRKILVIRRDDRKPATFQFNKNYSSWVLSSPQMTERKRRRNGRPVISPGDTLSSLRMTKLSSPGVTGLSSPEMTTKEIKEKKR